MGCGGSVGEGYGPWSSLFGPIRRRSGGLRIAVPGTLTTAYLALKIFNPAIETVVVPFDRIIPEILAGNFDAGLIIHEASSLTPRAASSRFSILVSVARDHRPGAAAGRQRHPPLARSQDLRLVTKAVHDSIQHGLDHRDEALEYAMQFAAIWTRAWPAAL